MEIKRISAEKINESSNSIENIIEKFLNKNNIYELTELFKVLGDLTRIRILYTLFNCELCVKSIAKLLNLKQSSVSHQLKMLKHLKLVKFQRKGKSIFYSLENIHVQLIINMGLKYIKGKR